MASMANRPELLHKIFLNKFLNYQGINAVKFFIRNKPWIITIDNIFLFDADKRLKFV